MSRPRVIHITKCAECPHMCRLPSEYDGECVKTGSLIPDENKLLDNCPLELSDW